MLYRLGASARMGQDWFTKSTLAEALHIRPEEVQRWITLGWLKCRAVQSGKLQRECCSASNSLYHEAGTTVFFEGSPKSWIAYGAMGCPVARRKLLPSSDARNRKEPPGRALRP
jgi:hypothetical protein